VEDRDIGREALGKRKYLVIKKQKKGRAGMKIKHEKKKCHDPKVSSAGGEKKKKTKS